MRDAFVGIMILLVLIVATLLSLTASVPADDESVV